MKAFLLLWCLFCVQVHAAAPPAVPQGQTGRSLHRRVTKTIETDYLLFLPQAYRSAGTKRWPLILFLHGAGERGSELGLVAVHGPPKFVQNRADFPFVVVSPQCPEGQLWQTDVLLALLDDVLRRYRVDPKRVYLTGLSMGGYGTWELGLSHPERFAALAPICGGGDLLKILLATPARAQRLKQIPVWAFHGAKDTVVPLQESEQIVQSLRRIGNDAKLTVYPEAAHDSWTESYNNPALYDWFLSQSNPVVVPARKKR